MNVCREYRTMNVVYYQVFIIMKMLLMSGQGPIKVVVFIWQVRAHIKQIGFLFFSDRKWRIVLYRTGKSSGFQTCWWMMGVVSSSWLHDTVLFPWLHNVVACPYTNCSRIICTESYPQHLGVF
jgi:hypothetical protein